ncbi:glucose-1-phosphate adenylyltransferase [Ectothiorhodospiraceae bacterium 2226]|nr:glucose-1-phosphate adenylyltransferase [Ectothiorhodospiraceae bacterium 2226]
MPDRSSRFVSRLTRDTLGLVLAGGSGTRLRQLTQWRSKPAVPFGGKFRIIDFPLSNCLNSGIRRIGILTQYKAHSLIRHVQQGWNFLRAELGEFIELLPAQQRLNTGWYAGTADAVYQNLDIIRTHNPEFVLILAGDHVYKMDYGPMLAYHVEHHADLTVGCIEVPVDEARGAFGVMQVDPDMRVRGFQEKPQEPESIPGREGVTLASMGIYVFSTQFLFEQLIRDHDAPGSSHDFAKDIIVHAIDRYRVMAYPFRDPITGGQGYWRDVGTVDAYWDANMELVGITPELNMYDQSWPIWTYQAQLPPAKFVFNEEGRRGMATDSLVSGGCIISGAVLRHSLLFSNVFVDEGSQVTDSVILPDVVIGRGCRLHKVVVDKGCKIPDGTVIGEDRAADAERYHVSENGVVLVVPEMLGQELHHAR